MPDTPIIINKPKDIDPWAGGIGFVAAGKSETRYDVGAKADQLGGLRKFRAYNQPWHDKLGNSLLQMVGTVVGQSLEGIGAITEGLGTIFSDQQEASDGILTKMGNDIREGTMEAAPIYYDENWGAGYILANLPSVASSLSLMLPGIGVGRLAGGLARAAKLGTFIEKTATLGFGGVAMRHAENKMEADQVYRDIMSDYSMGTNRTGYNQDGLILDPETAKTKAKDAAGVTYMKDWANVFFDIAQLGMVTKGFSGFFGKAFGDNALTSSLDYGYRVTKGRFSPGGLAGASEAAGTPLNLLKGVGKNYERFLKSIDVLKPALFQTTEGVEEMVNYIAQQEGYRHNAISTGQLQDDGSSYMDRIQDTYLRDKETWNSGAWGLIGGVVFQTVGSAANNAINKSALKGQIQELESRLANVDTDLKAKGASPEVIQKEKDSISKSIQDLKTDMSSHGWWNNLSDSVEMLSGLKHREEQLSRYKTAISDPAATETDKEVAKAQLKSDLFFSDTTGRNLQLLVQDISHPEAQKALANSLGMPLQEAIPVLNELKEDAEFALERLRDRQGDSFRSLFGAKKTKTDIGLDVENLSDVTVEEEKKQRLGSFVNPRIAVQLAYNDVMIRSLSRLNENLSKSAMVKELELFKNGTPVINESGEITGAKSEKPLSENARRYISLKADLAALDAVKLIVKNDLNSLEEMKTSEDSIASQKKLLTYTEEIIKEREQELKERHSNIENNLKDEFTADLEVDIKTLDAIAVGNKLGTSYKIGTFQNQIRKAQLVDSNDRLVKDSDRFEKSKVEDYRKINEYMDLRQSLASEYQKDMALIREDMASLISDDNEEFKKLVEGYERSYRSTVEATPIGDSTTLAEAKGDAVVDLQLELNADFKKATAAGELSVNNRKEYDESFNRKTYQELNARDKVLSALAVEYPVSKMSKTLAHNQGHPSMLSPAEMNLRNLVDEADRLLSQFKSIFTDSGITRGIPNLTRLSEHTAELNNDLIRFNEAINFLNSDDSSSYSGNILSKEDANRIITEIIDKYKAYPVGFLKTPIEEQPSTMAAFLEKIVDIGNRLESSLTEPFYTAGHPLLTIPLLFRNRLLNPFLKSDFINTFTSLEDFIARKDEAIAMLENYLNGLINEAKGDVKKTAEAAKISSETLTEAEAELVQSSLALLQIEEGFNPEKAEKHDRINLNQAYRRFPATNDEISADFAPFSVVNHKPVLNKDGSGRRIANSSFIFAERFYIGDEKNDYFVDQHSTLELRRVDHIDSVTKIAYSNIEVWNNGKKVGILNPVNRVASMKASYLDKMKENSTPEDIAKKESEFDDIIENITKIDKQLKAYGDRAVIKLGNPFDSENPDSVSPNASGGSYFGKFYNINNEVDASKNPLKFKGLSLLDAFGNDLNTKNKAILSIYYNGQFYVQDENGDRLPVQRVHPGIHISEKYGRDSTGSSYQGTNGFTVVLLPSHNKNGNGEHVYVPANLNIKHLADSSMTSSTNGSTMGGRIFTVIMDPENNLDEYLELLKLVGLDKSYNRNESIYSKANLKTLKSFYTTQNIIKVFNKVLYVYNPEDVIHQDSHIDFSKHLGMSVYTKEDTGVVYLRVAADLSKQPSNPNNYYIQLFNESGEFQPDVRDTHRSAAQLNSDLKRGTIEGDAMIPVVTFDEIISRLDDSLFRVDFQATLPIKSGAGASYTGLSFDQKSGKLTANKYDNYIKYLSDVKGVTSVVYGLDHSFGPIANRKTVRSYFHSRQLFLNPASMQAVNSGKKETPKKATPVQEVKSTSTAIQPEVVAANNVVAIAGHENTIQYEIAPELKTSIEMSKLKLIKLTKDEVYYDINESFHSRMHSFLPKAMAESAGETTFTKRGNIVDKLSKHFFNNTLSINGASDYNMSTVQYEMYLKSLRSILKRGEMVVHAGIVVHAKLPDGRLIAGEIDLLTKDAAGNYRIYDFKTHGGNLNKTKLDYYAYQLSGYAAVFNLMTGLKIAKDGLIIIPTIVQASSNEGDVKINNAILEDLISLPFKEEVLEQKILNIKEVRDESSIKEVGEDVKYPLEDKNKWQSLGDEQNKGDLVSMTPDEFLSKATPLEMTKADREKIDKLKQHISDGKKLDPLKIYSNVRSSIGANIDGRHRAVAAKELGIKEVPVLDYTTAEKSEVGEDNSALVDVVKEGFANVETENATMFGLYGDKVLLNDEMADLPKKGFLVSQVNLKDQSAKGKGFGQQLYEKALDKYGTIFSQMPITEDAIRAQDALVKKGKATVTEIDINGQKFRVLEKSQKVSVGGDKSALGDVYKNNTELSKIGDEKEYSEYIDSVFPDSKVKDVVYRADRGNNPYSDRGIYLTIDKKLAESYSKSYRVPVSYYLLNFINPKTLYVPHLESKKSGENIIDGKNVYSDSLGSDNINFLKSKGYDSVILTEEEFKKLNIAETEKKEIVAFDSEQLHQLGSKQDIEGFKKWKKSKSEKVSVGGDNSALKGKNENKDSDLTSEVSLVDGPIFQLGTFDSLSFGDEPRSQAMASLSSNPVNSSFIDIQRNVQKQSNPVFDYGFNMDAESMISNLIIDQLYNLRINRGNKTKTDLESLNKSVLGLIKHKIEGYENILNSNVYKDANNNVSELLSSQRSYLNSIIPMLKNVKRFFDWNTMDIKDKEKSNDFVGYFYTAYNSLVKENILDNRTVIKEVDQDGEVDEDFEAIFGNDNPGQRFITNATVRLNPKNTVGMDAKILFNKIIKFKTISNNNETSFVVEKDGFGMPKRFDYDSLMESLYPIFSSTNPSKLMKLFDKLASSNVIVYSIDQTFRDIASSQSQDSLIYHSKRKQLIHMLSSALKQHRKLGVLRSKLDGKSGPSISVMPADRQKIRATIINGWENNFKRSWLNFFDIKEIPNLDNPELPNQEVSPKIQGDITKQFKGRTYTDLGFNFEHEDLSKASIIDSIYNVIKRESLTKAIRIKFDFIDGVLAIRNKEGKLIKVGKDVNDHITEREAYQIAALFQLGEDIIVSNNSAKDYLAVNTESPVFQKTHLEQISFNISTLLANVNYSAASQEGVATEFGQYHPVIYKLVADQMLRLGIQLAEDPSLSWKVLAELNKPIPDSKDNKKHFNLYDKHPTTLSSFMRDKISTLFINKLLQSQVFETSKNTSDEFGDEQSGKATNDIINPFENFIQALEPFAMSAGGFWLSNANSMVRNVNGKSEYTYVPHNTMSLLMNEIKDPNSLVDGLLADVRNTAGGKHNWYLSRMTKSSKNDPVGDAIIDMMELHYENGFIINDKKRISPEDAFIGVITMDGWVNYFGGESSRDRGVRKPGFFNMTFSDSSIIPKMRFFKDFVPMNFRPFESKDGLEFSLELSPVMKDGSESLVYEKLYSVFKTEVHKVYEASMIWEKIKELKNDKTLSIKGFEERIKKSGFIENVHYKRDANGIISGPGSAVLLTMFGRYVQEHPSATGLFNKDGSFNFSKYSGGVDDVFVRDGFAAIIDGFLNTMVNDAYKGALGSEGNFFQPVVDRAGNLTFKFPYLPPKSIARVNELFTDHTALYNDEGDLVPVDSVISDTVVPLRDPKFTEPSSINPGAYSSKLLYMMRELDREVVDVEGMTQDDINELKEAFLKNNKERYEASSKLARLPYIKMKYMIADRIINNFIMQATIAQMTFDISSLSANDYKSAMDKYNKRRAALLAPGNSLVTDGHEFGPYSIIFNDDILGHRKMEITDKFKESLSPLASEYLNEFIKRFSNNPRIINAAGMIPVQTMSTFYIYEGGKIDGEKSIESRWKLIEKMMLKLETTNGGGFTTAREFFARLQYKGVINSVTYHELVKKERLGTLTDEDMDKVGRNVLAKLKYVYAGSSTVEVNPKMTEHIRGFSGGLMMLMTYLKNSEFPLINGWTVIKGSDLDLIRQQAQFKEDLLLKNRDHNTVLPGIVLNPPSAGKSGNVYPINLRNDDGTLTNELFAAPATQLNRDFHREQQEGGNHESEAVTMSSQNMKYVFLDIPFEHKFGKLQFDNKSIVLENLTEEELEDMTHLESLSLKDGTTKAGITRDIIETSLFRIFSILAKRKTDKLLTTLGIDKDSFEIKDIQRVLNSLINYGEGRYGIDSNTIAYMKTIEGSNEMKVSLSLNPSRAGLQSVLLSMLTKGFTNFKMPGALLTTTPAIGVLVDHELAAPMPQTGFKIFETFEDVFETFDKSELHSEPEKLSDGKWKATYKYIKPGETIVPWNFRDVNGNLLKYEDYVNEDGTIKSGKIDPEVLKVIANRIPNTGKNTSSALEIIRFFPKGIRDAMAVNAVLYEIMNADHDYDKLYTYMPNYTVDESGKIVKIQPQLHSSQITLKGDNIGSSAIEQYVIRRLQESDSDYQSLKREVDELESNENEGGAVVSSKLGKIKSELGQMDKAYKKAAQLLKEKEIEKYAQYRREYYAAGFYGRQSDDQLYNAIIDFQWLILTDIKSANQISTPLSTDTFHSVMDKVINTPAGPLSISDAFTNSATYHFASYYDMDVMRSNNNTLEKMIGISAIGVTSIYNAQRYGLFYNVLYPMLLGLDVFDEYESTVKNKRKEEQSEEGEQLSFSEIEYAFLIDDNNGVLKNDDVIESENSTIRSSVSRVIEDVDNPDESIILGNDVLYTTIARSGSVSDILENRKRTDSNTNEITEVQVRNGLIAKRPSVGRFRGDGIWTINNQGVKIYVSDYLKSAVQSNLDRQNVPINPVMNLVPETYSAWLALINLRYTDEASLIIMQDVIRDYANFKAGRQHVNETITESKFHSVMYALSKVMGEPVEAIIDSYNTLPNYHKDLVHFVNVMISHLNNGDMSVEVLTVSENDLLAGMGMSKDILSEDMYDREGIELDYQKIQLKALRTFLLADQYGQGLTNISIKTNYISGGAANNITDFKFQKEDVEELFKITATSKEFKTSVPAVGGTHRMFSSTQSLVKNGHPSTSKPDKLREGWKPSLAAMGYYQGLVPVSRVLNELSKANMFFEGGRLFEHMQSHVMNAGWIDKRRLFGGMRSKMANKLNVNFASYLLSNPELFRNLFNSAEEFNYFKDYGDRAQFMPDTSLPNSEYFSIFKDIHGVAAMFELVSEELDENGRKYKDVYPIFKALQSRLQVSEKWPSNIFRSRDSSYMKNAQQRIAISIMDMLENKTNPRIVALGKRLLLMAYQTGGVMSFRSIVQYINPDILFKIGWDTILKNVTDSLTDNIKEDSTNLIMDSFAVQFFQHNPEELKIKLTDRHLETFPVERFDKDGVSIGVGNDPVVFYEPINNNIISIVKETMPGNRKGETALVSDMPLVVKYRDGLWLRVDELRFDSEGHVYYQRIGLAGHRKDSRNEFKFQDPNAMSITFINSLYGTNRVKGMEFQFKGIPEIGTSFVKKENRFDRSMTEEGIEDLYRKGDMFKMSFSQRLQTMESRGEVTIMEFAKQVGDEVALTDSAYPLGIISGMHGTVEFLPYNATGNSRMRVFVPTINPETGVATFKMQIELNHPNYIKDGEFNKDLFIQDIGHEFGHLSTLYGATYVLGDVEDAVKVENRMSEIAAKGDVERKLVNSVKDLMKLHSSVSKLMDHKNNPLRKEWVQWKKLVKKVNNGDAISTEDTIFFEKYKFFRSFKDFASLESQPFNGFLEFVADLGYQPGLQKLLNDIPVTSEGGKGFWESVKDILADILIFFGLLEITSVKDRYTKKSVFSTGTFAFRGDEFFDKKTISGKIPDAVLNLEQGSALHVGLSNLFVIQDATVFKSKADYATEAYRKNASAMASLPVLSNKELNALYNGVRNFDAEWPVEIKQAYHTQVMDNKIIC